MKNVKPHTIKFGRSVIGFMQYKEIKVIWTHFSRNKMGVLARKTAVLKENFRQKLIENNINGTRNLVQERIQLHLANNTKI